MYAVCDTRYTCGSGPQVGGNSAEAKKTLKFFQEDGTTPNLVRHMEANPRQQASVKEVYVKSVKNRGIVESVRGEAWAVQAEMSEDGRRGAYKLLSCASLVESFYTALADEPSNELLLATLRTGLVSRVISHRTPSSILRYLVTLHNQFHHGASTNYLELIRLAPQACMFQLSRWSAFYMNTNKLIGCYDDMIIFWFWCWFMGLMTDDWWVINHVHWCRWTLPSACGSKATDWHGNVRIMRANVAWLKQTLMWHDIT